MQTIAQIYITWYGSFVILDIIEKKHIKIILFAYLILALIGSSAISAGEAFCIEYSNNDSLSSGRCFSQ